MKKSDIIEFPEFYGYYISLSEDIDLMAAFDKSLKQIDALDVEQLQRIGLRAYAEGKWTINKLIQHLTDWERIWCYRTLLFARMEGSSIPNGLEENVMAANCNADEIPIEQIVAELRVVRLATMAMFESFNDEILMRNCKFSKHQMSVLAMGFNIIGHQVHHFKIIKERYLLLDY